MQSPRALLLAGLFSCSFGLSAEAQSPGPQGAEGKTNREQVWRTQHGLGSDSFKNCTPNALVAAAGKFGSTARVPTLWIYTENDSFFRTELAQRMVQAYTAAGGRATYKPVGPMGNDGHSFVTQQNSSQAWGPIIAEFLASLR